MGKLFGWSIILGVVWFLGYVGIHVIKVRLGYSDIKGKAETMLVPSSRIMVQNIPDELMEHAEERGIPLKKDSIRLFVDEWGGYKVLSFSYRDSFLVFDKPIYFSFSFIDTAPLR
ncbi:hypothetical protein KAW18_08585 [candidate division WOR-3 bacterium]|nr:hypothetical protein [candidate division WOR-3 bacterium]